MDSYLLFSCYHRDVLTTVTENYGVDLSKCQIVPLSQPDVLPDFSCPATDFANQSFLIIASSRHLSVAKAEAVSIYNKTIYNYARCIIQVCFKSHTLV